LFNPDFTRVAQAIGVPAEEVSKPQQIETALTRGISANSPYFIEVHTRLSATPPRGD
jgi:acetolactate synthase-1/2/3 large subunit